MNYLELDQTGLARLLDSDQTSMNAYMYKDRLPRIDFLMNFANGAKFKMFDVEWLLTGRGEMIKKKSGTAELEHQLKEATEKLELYQKLEQARENNNNTLQEQVRGLEEAVAALAESQIAKAKQEKKRSG